MAEIMQKIIGKICPIRHPERGVADTYRERLCTEGCSAFHVFYTNKTGGICGEANAEKAYQVCRMWPGE